MQTYHAGHSSEQTRDQQRLAAAAAWPPRSSGAWARPAEDDMAPPAVPPLGIMFPGPPVGLPTSRTYGGNVPWTNSETGDPFTDGGEAAVVDVMPEYSIHLEDYNRLADKYGLPLLSFDADLELLDNDSGADRRNWFARAFGKPPTATPRRASRQSARSDRSLRHKRSESDNICDLKDGKDRDNKDNKDNKDGKDGKDALKNESLQTLVRLCGKSLLYLPSEYATRALTLPTCIRAAAQYLAQNGPETRGVFRISGSTRVVGELYDYYCINIDEADIAATVRSPNLPFHIHCGAHDVASVFKRLLAGLPGGILGHMSLFDALVQIHRLFPAGADDGVRARLLALAVGAVPSQLQRELICAVFGILCLIGRTAKVASSRGEVYGSRPTNSELMGFGALGIIFGPLLLGDLLGLYPLEGSDDTPFSSLFPSALGATPSPRSRRRKSASEKRPPAATALTLDKVLLANSVAEMLITHWALVVEQMNSLSIMRKQSLTQHQPPLDQPKEPRVLRPSRSETFSDLKQRSPVPQTVRSRRANLRKTRSESVSLDQTGKSKTTQSKVQQPPAWPMFRQPAEGYPGGFAYMKGEIGEGSTGSFVKQAAAAFSQTEEQTAVQPASPRLLPPAILHADNHATVDSGMTVPSWRSKLKPVNAPTEEQVLKRAFQDKSAAALRRSSFGVLTSSGDGSPSKTTALIARIMNPRTASPQTTTPQLRRTSGRNEVSRIEHGNTLTSRGNRGNVLETMPVNGRDEAWKKWQQQMTRPDDVREQMPMPERRWRARTMPSSMEANRTADQTAWGQSRNAENEPMGTPSKEKPIRGDVLRHKMAFEAGTSSTSSSPVPPFLPPPPLSEIKNEAKVVQRTHSNRSARSTRSRRTVKSAAEETDMSAAGTVKAMAALFDSGARTPTPSQDERPKTPQTPMTPKTPKTLKTNITTRMPGSVSKYKMNSPVKEATRQEAMRSTPKPEGSVSAIRDARERRRMRLSRSEGKGTELSDTRPLPRPMNARGPAGSRYPPRKESPSLRRGFDIARPGAQQEASPVLRAQLQDLRRQLDAKSVECEAWKKRAETAERAVAELEGYGKFLGDTGDEDTDGDVSDSSSSNMTVVVSRLLDDTVLRVLV